MVNFFSELVLISCIQLITASGVIDSGEFASKTDITNLNFDCLANVCSYLSDEDLLSVSQANSYLTEAANYVFQHQSEKIIHISDDSKPPHPEPQDDDLRLAPATLKRIFLNSAEFHSIIPTVQDGITRLAVNFRNLLQPAQLFNEIIKLCSKQLITIEFYGLNETFSVFRDSFPNVGNVAFVDGTMNENTLRLNRWFPAMKSLKLSNVNISNPRLILTKFPKLVTLSAEIHGADGFSLQNFKEFLFRNPQIRSLNIMKTRNFDAVMAADEDNSNFIEFINVMLPNLEELKWGPSLHLLVRPNTLVTFRNVKKFETFLVRWDQISPISFAFEKLESLSIEFGFWNPIFVPFIANQTELTKLKLKNQMRTIYNQRLRNVYLLLPKLSEVYIDGLIIAPVELSVILKNCRSLTKFQWTDYRDSARNGDQVGSFEYPSQWQHLIERTSRYITYTFMRNSSQHEQLVD